MYDILYVKKRKKMLYSIFKQFNIKKYKIIYKILRIIYKNPI